MKLAYPPAYLMGKSLDMVLPGHIYLCPAPQAGENIAQNASLLGNQWVCGGLDVCLRRGARDHEVDLTGMLREKLIGFVWLSALAESIFPRFFGRPDSIGTPSE